MTRQKLLENLQTQLTELEMLQSVYCNPGEIRVDDSSALSSITKFVEGESEALPPFLDITVNLLVEDQKFEVCINLSHDYPEVEPDIYVRNSKIKKENHAKLNKELSEYVAGLERFEPCIFSAVSWLQDHAEEFVDAQAIDTVSNKESDNIENETLIRFWIYSHHIYSKTKRKEILDLAHSLNITGFSLPGKPGIICVEGKEKDCNEWWQGIKSMNWKRIFCKVTEESKEKPNDFFKFSKFEEKVFQNNSIKCAHMDMGELLKFLEEHKCGYIFKDLFGVEAKTSI